MSANTSTKAASSKVLQTTELLESILLQLDMRTLLTSAQRVSRSWRLLILDSSNLQRALFLKPDFTSMKRPNPLLMATFPFCFEHCRLTDDQPLPFIANCRPVPEFCFGSLNNLSAVLDRKVAFCRSEASWKRMLVHQPPLKAGYAAVSILHHGQGRHMALAIKPLLDEHLFMPALLRTAFENSESDDCPDDHVFLSGFRVVWRDITLGPDERERETLRGLVENAGVLVHQLIDPGRICWQHSLISHFREMLLNPSDAPRLTNESTMPAI